MGGRTWEHSLWPGQWYGVDHDVAGQRTTLPVTSLDR